jgi:4-hydroxy-L-threonine phosphate dehydrogenase PdxA
MTVPRLAMVLGDPAGIGPEIASRLLAEAANREKAAVLLVADRAELEKGMRVAGARFEVALVDDPEAAAPGRVSPWDFRGDATVPFERRKPTANGGRYALERRGLPAEGPYPADTIFLRAQPKEDGSREVDAIVTMYHDQGQIAMKLMGFWRGVTVAGGLPVPITTCAHGTGFDIQGRGVARVGALQAAFDLACAMAARRREARPPRALAPGGPAA